jgi:hypothetical protein
VLRRLVSVTYGKTVTSDNVLNLALNADVIVTGSSTFRNIADVENPAENLVGIASSASEGAVTAEQLEGRPLRRPGEVLETVPGMVISQHSGEGKANQYYLRGFNLDHGTDFSTTVAGVPVNTPTGAHAHGYADLSFLIPETRQRSSIQEGAVLRRRRRFLCCWRGQHQLRQSARWSGSVHQRGQRRLEATVHGLRLLESGTASCSRRSELNHNDGPWVRPDDYKKVNGVLRYSRGDNRNGFSLTGMGYWANWESTDQVGRASRFQRTDSALRTSRSDRLWQDESTEPRR